MEFLTPRHTKKTKTPDQGSDVSGEFYPGITPEGEEIVREHTRNEYKDIIESAEPGAVIIFGGASDLARTKSSSRVSGSELKKIFGSRPEEYQILDESDINSLVKDKATESTLHALKNAVAERPDKKAILVYPLFISELSFIKRDKGRLAGQEKWKTDGTREEWTPYLTEVMKQGGGDEFKAVEKWVESDGKLTTETGEVVEGPKPLETAQNYVTALQRLERTAKKLFPGRPLVIEATGHSWDIDVMIAYLTHEGKIDAAGVTEIAKGTQENPDIISEFESPVIKISGEKAAVNYRGKTYDIDPRLLS